jgi:hypothetical protein
MDQNPVTPTGNAVVRRRPRYILGTFWMLIGLLVFFSGFNAGAHFGLLVGPALIAYAVYLYRGGRFGVVVW